MKRRRRVSNAACDSSGFACGHASRYYVKRRAAGQDPQETPAQSITYQRYAKLEMVLDTANHLVVGALATRGPAPDVDRLIPLLDAIDPSLKLEQLSADAGYDSELNHLFARVACDIRSLMPAKAGRPGAGPPRGRFRRQMREQLATKSKRQKCGYAQRVQAETGFSMIKRRQGEFVAARTFENQCAELLLMVITHNVMIIYVSWGFLRSRTQLVFPINPD
jgi:transposase